MDISDLRTIAAGAVVHAEVCIVGSGPVGHAVASELALAGISVVVIESGGREPDAWVDSLNEVENVGAPRVVDQRLVRNRGLGGSSRTWSGRLAAFDNADFERRPWVPGSGWPIARPEMARFLAAAATHLGGVVGDNLAPGHVDGILARSIRFDGGPLVDYLWSYSRHDSRSRDFRRFATVAEAPVMAGVRCLLNATVTQVEVTAQADTVIGLEVGGLDGRFRRVSSPVVVLCAGGIENARLLLASDRVVRGGLGNAHDQVGRHLMDHQRGPVARFREADIDAAQRTFGSFRRVLDGTPTVLTRGVAFSRNHQRDRGLLNAAAWLNGRVSPEDPIDALSRMGRMRGDSIRDAITLARGAPRLVQAAARFTLGRSPVRRMLGLDLECMVEVSPDPDSRITLSNRRDVLGVPISRVDWRVGEREARTLQAMAHTFMRESARLGLPVPQPTEEVDDGVVPASFLDVAHPTGATRMSSDPATGVVDTDCAVFGIRGLFVAGSSVFPSSGHANPTQTAVALAIRLARHIASDKSDNSSWRTPSDAVATASS
ncbi:GMC family oxidoreductase [Lichenibacterium minor]|uniref:GMC family oxidoreductase n=1 Tax=Lichenibacterium minor TaxID=2316528 RepID=A0A4Q2TZX9_9HYPH|nr:GMC family oxidoreductase [Lichenibacterium minor]RYC29350.1 GMC family oxidoreductase [Lichenibacterium minor]